MHIQFMGAARTVTGSCFVIEAAGTRFAVDCGMFQGNAEMDRRNRETQACRPGDLRFILLTHAHIDHSGLLPRLLRDGFKGTVYCTPPTAELAAMMLEDSAHIQEAEAAWREKHRKRFGEPGRDEGALYTTEDARRAAQRMQSVEYGQPFSPHPGFTVRYHDAGHILGSAFLEIAVEEHGATSRLVFSGDLGRPGTLLMHDPAAAPAADCLFLESTYGDRNHKNEDSSLAELCEAVSYAHSRGEKVIIPAFAVGRTQEILYCLLLLHRQGRLPPGLPVYVDSPMAIRATAIFRKYRDYLDTPELAGDAASDLPDVRFTLSAQESQALNADGRPGVIIAASGMCNAGRIKHHLRHNVWRPGAAIVFVGYQGAGTPGRRIVDGAPSIRLFNETVAVRAKIFTIGGFSAHAGQGQLLEWVRRMHRPGMRVVLIHGEDAALASLSELIRGQLDLETLIPGYQEVLELRLGRMDVVQEPVAVATVNWDTLLPATDTLIASLRRQIEQVRDLPPARQIEARDALLDLNRHLMRTLSEL
jgi:metallo-beta-lactamase family protein